MLQQDWARFCKDDKSRKVAFHVLQFSTCGVVDLRSSDVVPPLLLNLTQDESGNVRFDCIDDTCKEKLSSSGGTTSLKRL